MAINLYKECRGTSDKECQLINRVVINRMQQSNQDACSVIFEKNQFSWTKKTPKKLQFENYQEMTSYYKIYEADQLARAFDNVDKSQNDNSSIQTTASNMTHYADRSLHNQPKWAHRMQVAYQTKYFVFYKA
jgi:spore germination cell wall hydrolase CwlJ-like protein